MEIFYESNHQTVFDMNERAGLYKEFRVKKFRHYSKVI